MDFVRHFGIRVTVTTVGDPPGWAATASHVGTPRNCYIFVGGNQTRNNAATLEGVPECDYP